MRLDKVPKAHQRNRGFTLFEMVVTICSIVILYMIAEQRLNDLPAAAERANFYAVLQQIKSGVSFTMVTKLAAGDAGGIRGLEGTNPMDLLIETPSNYVGELERVTDAVRRRNAWYFETSSGELVYVVGGSSIDDVNVTIGGIPVHLGQIRLKIMNLYADMDGGAGLSSSGGNAGSWEGLSLVPVRAYTWERRLEQPVTLE